MWDRTLRRFVMVARPAIPDPSPDLSPEDRIPDPPPNAPIASNAPPNPVPSPAARSRPLSAPRLGHLIPADLSDIGRTLEVYRQAVAAGLVAQSEAGRLGFVAMAEHARRIGVGNPCGLLAAMVRGGLVGRRELVTQEDEDRARLRLREWDRGWDGHEATGSGTLTEAMGKILRNSIVSS